MTLHALCGHPECPERISLLHTTLKQQGIQERCTPLQSRQATDAELSRAHAPAFVSGIDGCYAAHKAALDSVQFPPGPHPSPLRRQPEEASSEAAAGGAAGAGTSSSEDGAGDASSSDGSADDTMGDTIIVKTDVYFNEHTALAARTAAGCAIEAVEAVFDGRVDRAFAAVRPPGHHASREAYDGFCIFNNTAAAAHAALAKGVQRVLIFDWDIHHGNGTQDIFYEDPRVLTVSIHRRDAGFYPVGVGYAQEVGEGEGKGFNVNVGWKSKGMGDADYLAAYDLLLEPIISSFDPQLVIIGAGFDAAEGDWLGKCHMTPEGFGHLAKRLTRHAGGRVVAVLEGGYNTQQVADSSAQVVRVLLGEQPGRMEGPFAHGLHSTLCQALNSTQQAMAQFWPALSRLAPLKHRVAALDAELALGRLSVGPATGSPFSSAGVVGRRGAAAVQKASPEPSTAALQAAAPPRGAARGAASRPAAAGAAGGRPRSAAAPVAAPPPSAAAAPAAPRLSGAAPRKSAGPRAPAAAAPAPPAATQPPHPEAPAPIRKVAAVKTAPLWGRGGQAASAPGAAATAASPAAPAAAAKSTKAATSAQKPAVARAPGLSPASSADGAPGSPPTRASAVSSPRGGIATRASSSPPPQGPAPRGAAVGGRGAAKAGRSPLAAPGGGTAAKDAPARPGAAPGGVTDTWLAAAAEASEASEAPAAPAAADRGVTPPPSFGVFPPVPAVAGASPTSAVEALAAAFPPSTPKLGAAAPVAAAAGAPGAHGGFGDLRGGVDEALAALEALSLESGPAGASGAGPRAVAGAEGAEEAGAAQGRLDPAAGAPMAQPPPLRAASPVAPLAVV